MSTFRKRDICRPSIENIDNHQNNNKRYCHVVEYDISGRTYIYISILDLPVIRRWIILFFLSSSLSLDKMLIRDRNDATKRRV